MNSCLYFQSISKRFGSVNALQNVNLSVEPGRILALLGPNGAGKSTLFGCLLGLLRPTEGKVLLNGQEITDVQRSRFGYLAERVALYPHRSVRENGVFFAGLRGCPAAEVDAQIERVGLGAVLRRPARHLSKGMLQRLGLAIALAGQPDVLILDEPFNGLDPALLDGLQTILLEENRRGATLLISTHTISAVEPLASDVAVLLQGRLAAIGTLCELRERHAESSLEAIYHRVACRSRQARPLEVCV